MSDAKFPEIGQRFVPKDAPPKGAEVREVTGHCEAGPEYHHDAIWSKPVRNIVDPYPKQIPLDQFDRDYKLI